MSSNRTHGHTVNRVKSPTYKSWDSMRARCTYPSNPAFAYYQKHGVTLCDRWRTGEGGKSGFECFLDDMGERPSMNHSIDRWPNPTGNYERSNCRWATKREQANNRVTNRRVEYRGEQYTIADLARATGVSRDKLHHRISMGWDIEEAVHRPNSTGRRIDLGF